MNSCYRLGEGCIRRAATRSGRSTALNRLYVSVQLAFPEIADPKLYCQNLSLFGKLFIDHKVSRFVTARRKLIIQSVFFHVSVQSLDTSIALTLQVENFLFYVLCDASTSRRDQVMAFFSKVRRIYAPCSVPSRQSPFVLTMACRLRPYTLDLRLSAYT